MFKKLISLLLAVLMLFSMTACTLVSTDSNSGNSGNSGNVGNSGNSGSQSAADFKETTLIDNDTCTVKITSINEKGLLGYTLNLYLENKTDKELMFSLNNVSVNGFMCDPLFATIVAAGMKSNTSAYFLKTNLEANGITKITDITMFIKVYDNNDILSGNLVYEEHTIYPLGEDAVEAYVRTPVSGETVLFENDSCTMIVTGYDPNHLMGYAVNVYLENKTDKDLMFAVNGAAVNGFMCDPLFATVVAAGKRSNTQIIWYSSSLSQNGITTVESLSVPVTVYQNEDWTGGYLVEETFTLNP